MGDGRKISSVVAHSPIKFLTPLIVPALSCIEHDGKGETTVRIRKKKKEIKTKIFSPLKPAVASSGARSSGASNGAAKKKNKKSNR